MWIRGETQEHFTARDCEIVQCTVHSHINVSNSQKWHKRFRYSYAISKAISCHSLIRYWQHGEDMLENLWSQHQRGVSVLLQTTYRSHKWVDEASPDASTDISDWQNKSGGSTLLVRHVGQGQMCLGHADGQWTIALVVGKRKHNGWCVWEKVKHNGKDREW